MSKNKPTHKPEARLDLRFAIVASRYNSKHVDHLLDRVREKLRESKIPAGSIEVTRVPGANELPYVVNLLARTGDYDCVIALGVVIAGETPHHEIIGRSTADALQAIGLSTQIPVINGIIVTNNEEQANERVFGETDRGAEFALAALDIASTGVRIGRYLDELDRNDIERERNEEIFGSNFLDDDDDDDVSGDFPLGGSNPFHKN